MKDAFYFPHDSNAIQDPKMMILFYECGLMGIGLYWIIVEIMHQQEDGKITEESFKSYLKFYFKIDAIQNQQMLNTCSTNAEQVLNKIEQVLNSTQLFVKQDGFVFSHRVLKNQESRKVISKKRSLAGKKSFELRSKSHINSTNVQQVSTRVEQVRTSVEHTKGKERKGNTILLRSETAPFSPTKQVQDFFYKQHLEVMGDPYVADFGKDGAIFKHLVGILPVPRIQELIVSFFQSNDDFIKKTGYTVGVFKSQINKLKSPTSSMDALLEKAGLRKD